MFGVGFTEILLVLLVAYLILGPKRLFRLVREVNYYWQKIQAILNRWKAEINQVIEVDEKLAEEAKETTKLKTIPRE